MITVWRSQQRAADFGALVALYSDDELASPLRSTVPLLDFWREPSERLGQLARLVGPPTLTGNAELRFEYEVPVQRGQGRASCTDLMIVTDRAAMAIEAKYREPRYPTVPQWVEDGNSEKRREVLEAGWG